MPWSTGDGVPTVAPAIIVTNQADSPASRYCLAHSGSVSVEKNPNIPTMDLIYCTTTGSGKVDAWQYMSDMETIAPMIHVSGEMTGTGS
jgi:hypothetical protein